MIFKVACCNWCGNENLIEVNFDRIYCHNCGEYTDKNKIKVRDLEEYEQIEYRYKDKR